MHDLAFADATRPTPAFILRVLLQPYSLGHELILLQRRNPFVTHTPVQFAELPASEQVSALISAVLVCCQNWQLNQKPHRWLQLWRWRNRRADWPQEIAAFHHYRQLGTILLPAADPKTAHMAAGKANDEPTGRCLGSPFLARLITFMAGVPEAWLAPSLLDNPLGYCGCLYLAKMETEGAFQIENEREKTVREEFAQAEAEILAEQAQARATAAASQPNPDPAPENA